MAKNRIVAAVILFSVFLAGCAGKRINIDPSNPVYKPKNDFQKNYGFLITPDEKKIGYTLEDYPDLSEPIRPFDKIDTLGEFRRFEEHFWKIRDANPNVPGNEFKELIDGRIRDIENEIFFRDIDIPGTRFDSNGGLKSDLAHVYLLWGAPTPRNKAKLSESNYRTELMVWYYFYNNRPIFRFLFYDNYGLWRLFKNYAPALRYEDLFNPLISPLRQISNRMATTIEELIEIWQELERDDVGWIFRNALFEFSSYTDWVIEGGNNKDKFGALDPPEPAALTAKRFKPIILGQPGDLTGREFLSSSYDSFIPAKLDIIHKGRPSFALYVDYKDVDWEVKKETAETILDIRISFQHKANKKIEEFAVRLPIQKPLEEVERKRKGVLVNGVLTRVVIEIRLDDVPNFARTDKPEHTLRQLIDNLELGDYVVNADLRHAVTKKYNTWHEEIIIK